MTLPRHLNAALSLTAITLNLAFWSLALLALLPAKAMPRARPWFRRRSAGVYRSAVRVDSAILRHIAGASWHGYPPTLDPARPHIVLANHCSWADVFMIQDVIVSRGPAASPP